jgi:hypothetical protein
VSGVRSSPSIALRLRYFAAYFLLGYLSLLLHHAFFYPFLTDQTNGWSAALILVNLVAGGICFVKSLLAIWR